MIMAISTMLKPAMTLFPGSCCCRARKTSSPRPLAPTNEAMTTIERANMVVWLIPAIIVGRATGTCTLNNNWEGVAPKERAASTISGETCLIPRLVSRMAGGTA